MKRGEIREALRTAARELVASLPPDRGPTIRDLASAARVGAEIARHTVHNMSRAGELVIVGERRVEYRNKPVAEYRPADPADDDAAPAGYVDLGMALAGWTR
jgi:hypothetical protein